MALLAASANQALGEEIILRGGSVIRAPIIKQDSKGVVADLGHDVLFIPAAEILRVEKEAAAESGTEQAETRKYHTAESERLTTALAAERYGPAVVIVKTPKGLGSGFFINKEGYLLTNFHVIMGEKHISVTRFVKEGETLKRVVHKEVEIIATAPFHDLAVLQVKDAAEGFTRVIFPPKEEVAVGQTVFAIGNPMGLERTVTEGVVSQAARNFKGIVYLQVDAPINPGNSGGPLFNDRGQVIGVINMKVPAMEGLNFAIPIRHALYVLDHLDAFAYDRANPESGYVYPDPPRLFGKAAPAQEDNKEVETK